MQAIVNIWTTTNWDDNIVGLSLVLGALGIIWRYVVKPLRDGSRRVMEVISLVEHELKPNGGKTLRDAVNRIDRRVEVLEQARDPKNRTRSTDLEVNP